MDISTFYPNFFSNKLIAYVCLSIATHLNDHPRLSSRVLGLTSDASLWPAKKTTICSGNGATPLYRDAIPGPFVWPIAHRMLSSRSINSIATKRYLKDIHSTDIAYLWPGAVTALYKTLRDRGNTIVTERINTVMRTSKRLLDSEYESIGLKPTHDISHERVQSEIENLRLSHFVFSPSPAVTGSLLDVDIPAERIIETSYGLRNREILQQGGRSRSDETPVVLFVGRVGIRKGIHLLLGAWEHVRANARLRIVGRIDSDVRDLVMDYQRRFEQIEHIEFTDDLEPVYRGADVFVLPSLEEGSPLVTYLALGAGIPSVVSPMGAGGVIEDGVDGLIVDDPHDTTALAELISTLIEDDRLREQMSDAARSKAPNYTWDNVARRRAEEFLTRCQS